MILSIYFNNVERVKIVRCPFCQSELIQAKNKVYQTIIEHVENPNNKIHESRPTYVCDCLNSTQYFWDEIGDLHLNKDGDVRLYLSHKSAYGSLEAI